MMPSSGQMNVSNAASTNAGLASQIMNSPSRGKSPAKRANRQPIWLTSCRVWQWPPHGGYWSLATRYRDFSYQTYPGLYDRNPIIFCVLLPLLTMTKNNTHVRGEPLLGLALFTRLPRRSELSKK